MTTPFKLRSFFALSLLLTGCPDRAAPPDAFDAIDAIDAIDIATVTDDGVVPDVSSPIDCAAQPSPNDMVTFHRDRARTGWDPNEPGLTPTLVGSPRFGRLWQSEQLDSITIGAQAYPPHIYATPLYVDRVAVTGGTYDGLTLSLVFVATSNAFAYAINAFAMSFGTRDVPAGAIVWRARLGRADVVPSLDGGMPMGVLSTPVIDLCTSPPRIYVVSMDATAGWQTLALDLRSGLILPGWPVTLDDSTVSPVNRNGPSRFVDPRILSQRSALNTSPSGDRLYISFGAYYDGGVGWMIAVDTRTPRVAASFSGAPSIAPEANGGMWGPGGASVAADGTVCATSGNSPAVSHDSPNVWGQSLLCWDSALRLVGTFTPFNYCDMDVYDTDLGGSSPVLLPPLDPATTTTPHLIAFGGKQGTVYLVDRDHLPGGTRSRQPCSTDSTTDRSLLPPGIQPQFMARGPLNVFGPYSEAFGNLDRAKMRSTPALFRDAAGRVLLYVSGTTKASIDSMTSVPPSLARLRVVASPGATAYLEVDRYESTLVFINPGSPIVTSDASLNPVVWILDENAPRVASLLDPAVPHPILYAVDGTTMTVLWRSAPNELFVGGKYSSVTAARGVVFVGTDRVQAFGVRPM